MPSVELAMWKYFLEIQPGGVKGSNSFQYKEKHLI